MKTTPLTPVLSQAGAAFAVVNGWERVDYVKPDESFTETHSFRFNEVFDVVARDVAAVQSGAAIAEVGGFNRIEMTGADVPAFLDRMICGRVPQRSGRVGLGYMLNSHGCLKSEVTIANLPDGRVWLGSAAAAEFHDMDWLAAHLRTGEDVHLRSLTNTHAIIVLAGPDSRAILSRAARGDWSADAFPWLSVRSATIGIVPAVVMAVSFSGELAYEVHVPLPSLHAAWDALQEAAHGDLPVFGARAIDSMRLETGFLHWKADILTEFDPFETGLSRFVDLGKGDFVGRDALLRRADAGPRRSLVTLRIDGRDAPAHPGASVMRNDAVIGTVTSGDWGHRVGMNLAYAFVDPECAGVGNRFEVDIIGVRTPAEVIPPSPYDPAFERVRA